MTARPAKLYDIRTWSITRSPAPKPVTTALAETASKTCMCGAEESTNVTRASVLQKDTGQDEGR